MSNLKINQIEVDGITCDLEDRIAQNEIRNIKEQGIGINEEELNNRLSLLEEKVVPRRLNLLNELNFNSTEDLTNAYVYVDKNGVDSRLNLLSIKKSIDTLDARSKIQTSDEIPADLRAGDYVFLLKKEEK